MRKEEVKAAIDAAVSKLEVKLSQEIDTLKSEKRTVERERDEFESQRDDAREKVGTLEKQIKILKENPEASQDKIRIAAFEQQINNWKTLMGGPIQIRCVSSDADDEKPNSGEFCVRIEDRLLKYAFIDFIGKTKRGSINLEEEKLNVKRDNGTLDMEKLSSCLPTVLHVAFGGPLVPQLMAAKLSDQAKQKTIDQLQQRVKELVTQANDREETFFKAYQHFRYLRDELDRTPSSRSLLDWMYRKSLNEKKQEHISQVIVSLRKTRSKFIELVAEVRMIVNNNNQREEKISDKDLTALHELINVADKLVNKIESIKLEQDIKLPADNKRDLDKFLGRIKNSTLSR